MPIRTPSTDDDLYRWWRDALAGLDPPMHENEPQCGYFAIRLRKDGVEVPVRIWMDQDIDPITGELCADEYLRCTVLHDARDVYETWLWCCASPITKEQFDYLHARYVWHAENAPDHPFANPTKPVNWREVKF
jgi:hypothetical protein